MTPSEFLLDLHKRAHEVSISSNENIAANFIWSVLTILRGCDQRDFSNELKYLTVARARSVIGITFADIHSAPLTGGERLRRNGLLDGAPLHFQEHWRAAVFAIRALYHVDLTTEEEWVY